VKWQVRAGVVLPHGLRMSPTMVSAVLVIGRTKDAENQEHVVSLETFVALIRASVVETQGACRIGIELESR
jgi:hypothetical protein